MSKEYTQEKVLAIVGPTATGKSEVAILLAEKLGAEIIAADSMQVYRDLSVGTAKPVLKQQKRIKHHLIDVVDLNYDFSVAKYQKLARKVINDINRKGKLPILVGGSGLYVRAAVYDLDFPAGRLKSKARKELEKLAEEKGSQFLFEKLKKLDPEAASEIPPKNIRRVIRALEVIEGEGVPFSVYQARFKKTKPVYQLKIFGLTMPRELLYSRIEKRIDEMLKKGLLDEVRRLEDKGLGRTATAKQALGYKEILDYLNGVLNYDEAVALIKKRTRNFAKRQLTWFKADKHVDWISVEEKSTNQIGAEIIASLEQEKFIEAGK